MVVSFVPQEKLPCCTLDRLGTVAQVGARQASFQYGNLKAVGSTPPVLFSQPLGSFSKVCLKVFEFSTETTASPNTV